MFVDASAIVAILTKEDLAGDLENLLSENRGEFYVSPLVRFEATVALARARQDPRKSRADSLRLARAAVEEFISALDAQEISITAEIGNAALDVGGMFGKFVGRRADLNFGDCFAYACAK